MFFVFAGQLREFEDQIFVLLNPTWIILKIT